MTLTVKDGLDDTKSLDVEGVSPYPTAKVIRAGTAEIGKLAENAGVVIGAVTATLTCELPAGTAAIGKLTAYGYDDAVDIGNIDTVTHILDFEKIAGLTKGQGLMTLSLPVTIADDQSTVPVKRTATSVSIALPYVPIVGDSPIDYDAGDVVGGLLTFTNAVSAVGKRSMVKSLKFSGIDTTRKHILYLFTSDLVTPLADHTAFALAAADYSKFLGSVSIVASDYVKIIGSGTPFIETYCATVRNVGLQVQAGVATANVYGYLVVTEITARTPWATVLVVPYLKVDFEYMD